MIKDVSPNTPAPFVILNDIDNVQLGIMARVAVRGTVFQNATGYISLYIQPFKQGLLDNYFPAVLRQPVAIQKRHALILEIVGCNPVKLSCYCHLCAVRLGKHHLGIGVVPARIVAVFLVKDTCKNTFNGRRIIKT